MFWRTRPAIPFWCYRNGNGPVRDNASMRISLLLLISAGLLPAAPRIQIKLADLRHGMRADRGMSKEMQGEPRFQVASGLATQQIFG